jgi:hypothetical protein
MNKYRIQDVPRLVRTESGKVDVSKLTLFSTMKNELKFLPAWLAHHRRIGFEQFLIWDDASTDGSYEYLCSEPDCVVLRSDLGFGQHVKYLDPEGRLRSVRAGIYFKAAIPNFFLSGQYVGYLDADEFLILPPGVASVTDVIGHLRSRGYPAVMASLLEFFPADIVGLDGGFPNDFEGLLAAYPYFEPEPLIELRSGERPTVKGVSKTARLYQKYGINPPYVRRGLQKIWMSAAAKRRQQKQTSPRQKTPLILRNQASYQTGSHGSSLPPADQLLLTVAHFVFTSQSRQKIERAICDGNHTFGSRKYRGYAMLLDAVCRHHNGFLGENSVRYESPQQLLDCGLMKWPTHQ